MAPTATLHKTSRLFIWVIPFSAAVFSLAGFLSLPSSEGRDWLFGLSFQRLFIALFPTASIIFCLSMIVMVLTGSQRYRQIAALYWKIPVNRFEISGVVCFWVSLFFGAFFLYYWFFISPNETKLSPILGVLFPTLCAYLDRLWPAIMLAVFYMVYWVFLLLAVRRLPLFSSTNVFVGVGAAVFSILALIFRWTVFVFRLHVFEQIPGWYWPIIIKPNLMKNSAIFILLFIVLLFILYIAQRIPQKIWLCGFLTGLVFITMQYAIGFLEGRGLASLTDRYFLSYHRVYIEEACNSTDSAKNAIIHYEEKYPSMFFQTKPPGVLWLSFQVKHLANLPVLSPVLDEISKKLTLSEFLPRMASLACKRTMSLVTLLYPWVASSSIWLIYWFSKRVIRGTDYPLLACYSAILFLLAPNIMMLALFPDQAFYPPLFLLAAGITFRVMKNNSFWGCFLAGMAIYAANFLSFSMLPLFAIPVFYFALSTWQEKKFSGLWARFKNTLLPAGLGILFSLVLLKVFLNYDIFTRYQRMMATRIEGDFYTRLGISLTGEATILEKIHQTWNAAVLNNIELAASINIPVFVFFMVMGVRSLIHVIRQKPDDASSINASIALTYLALNATRAVLGEAGRLWMFWVPAMALLTVQYLLPFLKRHRWAMLVLTGLLVFSLFLSYQFQDYLMPQLLP